jgi:hypothetical protein
MCVRAVTAKPEKFARSGPHGESTTVRLHLIVGSRFQLDQFEPSLPKIKKVFRTTRIRALHECSISRGRTPGIGIGCCRVISRASSLRLHARVNNRIVLEAIHFLPNYRVAEARNRYTFPYNAGLSLVSQSSRCSIKRLSMGCSGLQTISGCCRDQPGPRPRRAGDGGEWHCFKKLPQVCGYVSLCQRQQISFVLGQQIARPDAPLRCSVCDGVEMGLRGWGVSGPASARRAGGSLSR